MKILKEVLCSRKEMKLSFRLGSSREWTVENKEAYKISHSPYMLCIEAVDIDKNITPSMLLVIFGAFFTLVPV